MLLDITSTFYSLIRGGLLVLLIYHIIFYLLNNIALHKYYSGYLFCIVVYLFRDIVLNENIQYIYQYISFPIQYVAYTFFINFSRELTNSKKKFPVLDRNIKLLSKVLTLIAIVLIIIQFFYGYEIQKKAVALTVPFTTLCAFVVFFLLSKSEQVFYLLLGSILFIFFTNISAVKMVMGEFYMIDWHVHRMFYYFVGAFIQSIVFAIILSNLFKILVEKKREADVSLLKQTNQISKLKIIALKSQMNPHFLFNCLNSINSFVIQNKVEEASNFITKFSSLIRKVLQTTNEDTISLSNELQILAIYVKLEQIRLKNSFTYKVIVDENINTETLKVVPLFLQPFIENAIWHGLSLKQGYKNIYVRIKKHDDLIHIHIVDNGIGIEASKKDKFNNVENRKSYGISIVKERMRLMYKKDIHIEIKDLSQENNQGTRVSLSFPAN